MKRLFPRCHRSLLAQGYSESAANNLLLAARRHDQCALVLVRVAVQMRRIKMWQMIELLADL